jgi:hypothetical protein
VTVFVPVFATFAALVRDRLPAPHRDVFLVGAVAFLAETVVSAWLWAGLSWHAAQLQPATDCGPFLHLPGGRLGEREAVAVGSSMAQTLDHSRGPKLIAGSWLSSRKEGKDRRPPALILACSSDGRLLGIELLDAAAQLGDNAHGKGKLLSHLAFGVLHERDRTVPPKGQSRPVGVRAAARRAAPFSAAEVAAALRITRATGQYLTALAESGAVEMRLRYGVTGCPEHEVLWASGG